MTWLGRVSKFSMAAFAVGQLPAICEQVLDDLRAAHGVYSIHTTYRVYEFDSIE